MKNCVSVLSFGAVGDGRRDDYAAIQAALNSGAAEICIPQGIYCVSETLLVPSDTHIIAEKTAKIVLKPHTPRHRNDFLLSNTDTLGGNRNIRITGGIWDGNNTAPEVQKPDLFDKNGYSGTVLNFVGVEGLVLKDMVIANSVTYYIRMSRLRDFTIEDISFVSDHFGVNQDGLHFGGDVRHGTVRNIRALSCGQTNDDLIALNADDSVDRVENLDLVRADIEDISFENLYAENCHTIIRILSVTAAIRNIHIKNVFGGFRCYALNADGARYCRTPLFREEEYPAGVGRIENISIENFTCYPVLDLPEGWQGTNSQPQAALMLESRMDHFRISNFRMLPSQGVSALQAANLTATEICADGKAYALKTKMDTLKLETFTELRIG